MKKKPHCVLVPLATVITANLIGTIPTSAQVIQENIEGSAEPSIVEKQPEVLSKSQQNLAIELNAEREKSTFVADNSILQNNSISTVNSSQTNILSINVLAANNQQPMAQVTSVSQLSDVQPTDWAFQALQSLVERYGCIAGYPDGTYRGNRALTRYEFAAGLNTCLDRVNELIATATSNQVTRADLDILRRLQEEFTGELATIRGRVDTLEAQVAELEANQFSTTTRLNGEIVVGATSVLAGDNAAGEPIDRIPTLGQRTRLNLETSFTGADLLTTRLQGNNIVPLGGTNSGPTLTNEGRVEFDGDSGNDIGLALLRYRFPITPRTNVYLAGVGNGFVDLDASSQLNPYFDGGAVSLFALRNPIYNYSGGTGLGVRHLFSDNLELNLGYLVPSLNAGRPAEKNGLFDGNYGALAQVIFSPSDNTRIGLTYINSYSRSFFVGEGLEPELNPDFIPFGTSTGSNLSNVTFGRPVSVNAYGVSGTLGLGANLAVSGWVGYANQRYIGRGDATVWNWGVGLAFPNLGREGNLGGIFVGMEPKVTEISSTLNGGQADPDTSLHLEAFYRYQLTDNIQITPGVIWLTAPNHNANNDDIVIGVLRTVFRY
ncbi:carbohydrate porin [Gloeocapsopsis crepidinum LEGE 06123]|uniref:Carbohydrate porin n=1 Tax=Gloeocapsopsis crepidinum LEGE 06123 TaxID=588587 RepID=A0ABR9UKY1_9CHRO|nr:iron uptake porin [Gloeocapsopsis crepidinum]MBE9188946.1 carbohydrate porin [Gloeocapsopsis crepidinum LEGE 06123]